MPFTRGRFFTEIESTGKVKRSYDILLWCRKPSKQNLLDLYNIAVLQDYLNSLKQPVCDVNIIVPASHDETARLLTAFNIAFNIIDVQKTKAETLGKLPIQDLADCAETALAVDADVIAINTPEWFPFIEELEQMGLFLTDSDFLKKHCEIFVRGFDVPWGFSHPTWNLPWNGFYNVTERDTFVPGEQFLHAAQKKNVDPAARETGRSFVYNRLPNLCFTRDRLLFFFEIQRLRAMRQHWSHQDFKFEIGYYLNFYYPLIYGGFDHLALLVNQTLGLGLPDKGVGATYKDFLSPLKAKNTALHDLFTDAKVTEFIKRTAALRHYASHRGSLAPSKLIQKPDKEPTNDELDAEITNQGLDFILRLLPEGDVRDNMRENLRFNFRVAYYEKAGGPTVDGVISINLDGKPGFIYPANETDWNFQKFIAFANQVCILLEKAI